jgi:Fe-S cluster assembly protein SufD
MRLALAEGVNYALVLREPLSALEMSLAKRSRLTITLMREMPKGSNERLASRADLAAQAELDFTGVACGAGSWEHDSEIRLNGAESSATLRGLSVLSGEASVKNSTTVHHTGRATTSRQLFKDILSDKSRAEYAGLVHVHKGADKTDSGQLARNLLLSDDARADSRPQLKIDADDVKCKHGSSIGQLSPQELFYLRSRGLAENEARRMLIYGFAEEAIESAAPGVKEPLEAMIDKELSHVLSASS